MRTLSKKVRQQLLTGLAKAHRPAIIKIFCGNDKR